MRETKKAREQKDQLKRIEEILSDVLTYTSLHLPHTHTHTHTFTHSRTYTLFPSLLRSDCVAADRHCAAADCCVRHGQRRPAGQHHGLIWWVGGGGRERE